ncbi:MAG: hypothetical protein ABSA39_06785 [Edaphobacter sp.]
MAPPLLAQHNCPQGFDYAGALRGTGSYGIAFDERRELTLPLYATIDSSFQQRNVRARAGNGQAKSDLRVTDIPKGILIIPSGSILYDNGWAVSAPELKPVGEPVQYRFAMKLYCISSSSSSNKHSGGCDVNVDVCYKPKK